jgi:uncharacterized protein YcfL
MPSARLILLIVTAAVATAGCGKKSNPDQNMNQNMSVDDGVPTNQVSAASPEIETLPADESSTTPSNQLQNGFDSPQENGPGSGNKQ